MLEVLFDIAWGRTKPRRSNKYCSKLSTMQEWPELLSWLVNLSCSDKWVIHDENGGQDCLGKEGLGSAGTSRSKQIEYCCCVHSSHQDWVPCLDFAPAAIRYLSLSPPSEWMAATCVYRRKSWHLTGDRPGFLDCESMVLQAHRTQEKSCQIWPRKVYLVQLPASRSGPTRCFSEAYKQDMMGNGPDTVYSSSIRY